MRWKESHIACGIDIGIASTQVLVHFDTVAADVHVRRFEAEVLDIRFASMRPDRVQIEPAGVTAGKSFSGSNTLLKKFVSEYMATSATISMTFASV